MHGSPAGDRLQTGLRVECSAMDPLHRQAQTTLAMGGVPLCHVHCLFYYSWHTE